MVPAYRLLLLLAVMQACQHFLHAYRCRAKMPPYTASRRIFRVPTMSEERLEKIETKIAFQEDVIEELNKTIYLQQKKLDRLEAKCEALAGYISSLAASVNENKSVMNERPPHY